MVLQCLLHEPQCRRLVAGFGDVTLEELALVINRTPQVMKLAVDPHIGFVQVPFPMSASPHPAYPLAANVGRKHQTKTAPPEPHRLVADIHPALNQKIFHVPQRERIPHVERYYHTDDLGR